MTATAKFEFTDVQYPANSSWIDAVYYNENNRLLGVVAQGRHYFYKDVPASDYQDSLHGSAGSWYNTEIQGTYRTHLLDGHNDPTEPVNYVRVAKPSTIGVRPGARLNRPAPAQLVTPKAKATSGYRIDVEFGPQHPVYAESLEAAIAKFKEDPMLYVNLVIKGVSSIDG